MKLKLLMPKLLLIEDDPPKQSQICDYISHQHKNWIIFTAPSINSAISLLETSEFDLVLLDMALPTFNENASRYSGGRLQSFGGRIILNYMQELELGTKVFLITQFPDFQGENKISDLKEIDNDLSRSFPELYLGYTHFQHRSNAWKQDLQNLLENA